MRARRHADHILPVYRGGGLCMLENLRTLCVVCHQVAAQPRPLRLPSGQDAGPSEMSRSSAFPAAAPRSSLPSGLVSAPGVTCTGAHVRQQHRSKISRSTYPTSWTRARTRVVQPRPADNRQARAHSATSPSCGQPARRTPRVVPNRVYTNPTAAARPQAVTKRQARERAEQRRMVAQSTLDAFITRAPAAGRAAGAADAPAGPDAAAASARADAAGAPAARPGATSGPAATARAAAGGARAAPRRPRRARKQLYLSSPEAGPGAQAPGRPRPAQRSSPRSSPRAPRRRPARRCADAGAAGGAPEGACDASGWSPSPSGTPDGASEPGHPDTARPDTQQAELRLQVSLHGAAGRAHGGGAPGSDLIALPAAMRGSLTSAVCATGVAAACPAESPARVQPTCMRDREAAPGHAEAGDADPEAGPCPGGKRGHAKRAAGAGDASAGPAAGFEHYKFRRKGGDSDESC